MNKTNRHKFPDVLSFHGAFQRLTTYAHPKKGKSNRINQSLNYQLPTLNKTPAPSPPCSPLRRAPEAYWLLKNFRVESNELLDLLGPNRNQQPGGTDDGSLRVVEIQAGPCLDGWAFFDGWKTNKRTTQREVFCYFFLFFGGGMGLIL